MKSAVTNLSLDMVWTQYQQALRGFLHAKLSDPDDADDLHQEILIKTHQNLHQVQDVENVKAWLFQLANRTIIDFYRKRARQRRDNDLVVDDLWFEPSSVTIEQEMSGCMRPFIHALPPEQSQLLDEIELQGKSQTHLAEKIGLNYSTLKSRVQKSRAQLKKMFQECCTLELDQYGSVIDCEIKSKGCVNC